MFEIAVEIEAIAQEPTDGDDDGRGRGRGENDQPGPGSTDPEREKHPEDRGEGDRPGAPRGTLQSMAEEQRAIETPMVADEWASKRRFGRARDHGHWYTGRPGGIGSVRQRI